MTKPRRSYHKSVRFPWPLPTRWAGGATPSGRENPNMKKGMKLSEFTPVITEYEDASGFPDEHSANSYCKEMNNQSFGWTVEKVKLGEAHKWRVVWPGERILDMWEKTIG